MTVEKLKALNDATEGIYRIDEIVRVLNASWRRGWITGSKRPLKFCTGYGAISDKIDLEKDEIDAIEEYLEEKKKRLQSILDNG